MTTGPGRFRPDSPPLAPSRLPSPQRTHIGEARADNYEPPAIDRSHDPDNHRGPRPRVVATAADAASGPTARLKRGTVTASGITGRDVVDISMDHDLLSVDFGFDGTEAQFPMSRVQRLSVQLGAGDDGLRVIDTGVSDVPITIGAIHKVIPLLERTIGPPRPL